MKQIIAQINKRLRDFGDVAVQKGTIPGRGMVVGYKPQYVIDSVNAVLGPENWRYEVVEHGVERDPDKGDRPTAVWVMVRLFVRVPEGGEWFEKGQHFGHAFVTIGALGDALKGAVTDALGKAFSTLSIGRDAYAGILAANFPRRSSKQGDSLALDAASASGEAEPASPPASMSPISPQELGLSPIPGVELRVEAGTGTVVAVETEKGAAYNQRNLLRESGFRWDKGRKAWVNVLKASVESQNVAA